MDSRAFASLTGTARLRQRTLLRDNARRATNRMTLANNNNNGGPSFMGQRPTLNNNNNNNFNNNIGMVPLRTNTQMNNFNNMINTRIEPTQLPEDRSGTWRAMGGATKDFSPDENIPNNPYMIELDPTPYKWIPPVDRSKYPYQDHQGEGAQYLRDFILGINDGLISTLLLVVGLVSGGSPSQVILLAALSGGLAGAIAMGLGELIATRAQNEVIEGEIALEKQHLKYHRDKEMEQLRGYLAEIGFQNPMLEAVAKAVGRNDDNMMKVMQKFEFCGEPNDELGRSPLKAMFMSGRLYFIGAMPSTLPFIQNSPILGLIIALVLCSWALMKVGEYKTTTTGGSPLRGALENFGFGAIGAILSFLVGLAYLAIRNI